jgi:hypothetical protein
MKKFAGNFSVIWVYGSQLPLPNKLSGDLQREIIESKINALLGKKKRLKKLRKKRNKVDDFSR